MTVDYIYSISADTVNGVVNAHTLQQEISASAITIAIDHINMIGDALHIWFKAVLSQIEEVELASIVFNHTGTVVVLDTPDTIIAQLTLEGRNLLARCKLGTVVYKQLGWQLGRGGYFTENPVKILPINDTASDAVGYFEVVNNDTWSIGTYINLNGKWFIYGTHFVEGFTPELTIRNIQNAILDSNDLRHHSVVAPVVSSEHPNRLYIQSLITGEISNDYPISVYHVGTLENLHMSPMAGGTSLELIDAAWPIPDTLALFLNDEGLIEVPSSTSASFLSRIGEGISGLAAYGELGLWVEVLNSAFLPEVGRRVLFAVSHFPIQPKTDRSILTFRTVISF